MSRVHQWRAWINQVRADHLSMAPGTVDEPALRFFVDHYAVHNPGVLPLPNLPALNWTLDGLREKAGHVDVEVQVNRTTNPAYEIQSSNHRGRMKFAEFVDQVQNGDANDVYMTAQNADKNREMMSILAPDLDPLPSYLKPNTCDVFLWIGRHTITPLHHDLTNNLMCQLVGTKIVRLVSPAQVDKVDNRIGVHSRLGWLDDATAKARGIAVKDIVLRPGEALFLPVGWWHCVRALGVSMTAVYTSFQWFNNWSNSFPL